MEADKIEKIAAELRKKNSQLNDIDKAESHDIKLSVFDKTNNWHDYRIDVSEKPIIEMVKNQIKMSLRKDINNLESDLKTLIQ